MKVVILIYKNTVLKKIIPMFLILSAVSSTLFIPCHPAKAEAAPEKYGVFVGLNRNQIRKLYSYDNVETLLVTEYELRSVVIFADCSVFLLQKFAAGYEIKRGKYISCRAPGQEHFTRLKTLGAEYQEEH